MKKATKTAAKKVVAKKTATKVAKKAATKTAVKKVANKVAVKKAAPKKAPAKKAAAGKRSKTVIEAKIDIGFGNLLYIRGDAPGLSWKKGVPMDCKGSDTWTVSMTDVSSTFDYKVLINDIHWAVGGNDIAQPGVVNTAEQSF